MPPKAPAPASSSSDASSTDDDDDDEKTMPTPKPSTTTTTTAAQAPKPSSSEEDDADGNEEGEESSGSEDEDVSPDKPSSPKPQMPPNPTAPQPSDSGSTDSDSDSDSSDHPATAPRHSVRVADPSIKPLATKPMDATPSKPPQKTLKASDAETGASRQSSKRLGHWSEDDEIAVLRGMVDYHAKKGIVPSTSSHMDDFHDFIHESLQMEIVKTRLFDKVRRLRQKYETVSRSKKLTFAKPHDEKLYELSQNIWGSKKMILSEDGNDANGDADENSAKKPRRTKEEDSGDEDNDGDSAKVKDRYPFLMDAISRMGNRIPTGIAVERALELVDESKAQVLDEKYKKLQLLEMKSHMRQMELMRESMKLVVEALDKVG